MPTLETPRSLNYFRIAWQSGLAAGLCLGFPAGLLLWLILFQQFRLSPVLQWLIDFLQANGLYSIYILVVSSVMWSYFLGRISGYRPWWKIGLATSLGIIVGWFSPLSNMDGWFGDKFPIHTLYAVAMCGIVFSATSSVGLAYGFVLRNIRAALTMAFTTGFISVIAMLLTVILFGRFGIRVGGEVPLAMSKVTVTGLMTSAITGGAVLGVGFSWFVDK